MTLRFDQNHFHSVQFSIHPNDDKQLKLFIDKFVISQNVASGGMAEPAAPSGKEVIIPIEVEGSRKKSVTLDGATNGGVLYPELPSTEGSKVTNPEDNKKDQKENEVKPNAPPAVEVAQHPDPRIQVKASVETLENTIE